MGPVDEMHPQEEKTRSERFQTFRSAGVSGAKGRLAKDRRREIERNMIKDDEWQDRLLR